MVYQFTYNYKIEKTAEQNFLRDVRMIGCADGLMCGWFDVIFEDLRMI